MVGRGRKLLLGALRRGRTSARADSPARTRFARVRRAHSAACSSLPMANSDQSPSSAYLRPWASLPRPSLHLQPSCRLRLLPSVSVPPFRPSHARSQPSAVTSPRPLVAAPMRSALHHPNHPPFSTPWESPVSPSAAIHPRRRPPPRRRCGRQRARSRLRASPLSPLPALPCHISPSPRHRTGAHRDARHAQWVSGAMLSAALGHKGAAVRGARAPRNASPDQSRPVPHHRLLNLEPCPLRLVSIVVPEPRRRARRWGTMARYRDLRRPAHRPWRSAAAHRPRLLHGASPLSPGPGAQLAADRTCFPSSSSDAPGPWAKAVYTEWPRRAQEAVIVGRIARRARADV